MKGSIRKEIRRLKRILRHARNVDYEMYTIPYNDPIRVNGRKGMEDLEKQIQELKEK